MAATQYINADSGRFVTENAAGFFIVSVTASASIEGWLYDCYTPDHSGTYAKTNASGITTSTTAGGTVLVGTDEITTPENAVWMPVLSTYTLTAANVGDICDLNYTNSGTTAKQTVDPATNTVHHVKILDVDLAHQYALVYVYI